MCASAVLRSVMSRPVPRSPTSCPASSKMPTALTSSQRVSALRVRMRCSRSRNEPSGARVLGQPLAHPLGLAGRHEVVRGVADQLLVGVAPHALHAAGDVGIAALEVGFPDVLAGGIGEVAEARFALAQRRLGRQARLLALEVVQREGQIDGELLQHAGQLVVEEPHLVGVQVQRADHPALPVQQEGRLRAHAQRGEDLSPGPVARVAGDVVGDVVAAGADGVGGGPLSLGPGRIDGHHEPLRVALVLACGGDRWHPAGLIVDHGDAGEHEVAVLHHDPADVGEQLGGILAVDDGVVGLRHRGVHVLEPRHAALGQLALGDVLAGAAVAEELAARAEDGLAADRDVARAAVRIRPHQVQVAEGAAQLQVLRVHVLALLGLPAEGQLEQRLAQRGLGLDAALGRALRPTDRCSGDRVSCSHIQSADRSSRLRSRASLARSAASTAFRLEMSISEDTTTRLPSGRGSAYLRTSIQRDWPLRR